MVLIVGLLKTIKHKPLHLNIQKIILQEGPNFLQNTQIIYMEKKHRSSFRQKFVEEKYDKINVVVHTLIPIKNIKC